MLETPLLCRSDTGHTDHAAAAEDLSTSSFLQLAASSSCVVIYILPAVKSCSVRMASQKMWKEG